MPEESVALLNLEGIVCPQNSARALLHLEGMDKGILLDIIVDEGEPIKNVPLSLEAEGHEILSKMRTGTLWKIRVRKR